MSSARCDATGRPLVAIVGAAGLFPGASDLDAFWANIVAGRDCSSDVPPGRWQIPPERAYSAKLGAADHVYCTRGYFLDAVSRLDDDPLKHLDLSVHLAVHLAKEAWATAITSHLDRRRCGVVLGHIMLPTENVSRWAREILEPLFLSGQRGQSTLHQWNRQVAGLPAVMAARELGLGLGGLALDAACASSLYAIKLAVDELQTGRADAMIAGGLSRPDNLYTQMGFAQLHALSRSGQCAPFDATADGLVVGEGGGAFVLKRLDDAERAGDTIWGVIHGIGLSNDREGNVLAPASEGQLRAMRSAYRAAGWSPNDVQYIECHATGTPLGDAAEFNSLQQLWQGVRGDCALGAVKASVGHLLTGAGAAGLLKTLLALRHSVRPPLVNYSSPATEVDIRNCPFHVPMSAEEWPHREAPRRAAVSAFGFGGINAHVLVEEYRPTAQQLVTMPTKAPRVQVAVVGVAVRYGAETGLAKFTQRALGASSDLPPPLENVDVPFGRFPIPPREFQAMMPQQALMLLTAAEAFDDAVVSELPDPDRTGVFIGCELDLHTTDFHFRWSRPETERDAAGPPLTAEGVLGHLASVTASRIARMCGAGGPSFVLNAGDATTMQALALGYDAIARGELGMALIGAVDTPTDVREVESETPPVDAAVAWILEPLTEAQRLGHRVYAILDDSSAVDVETLSNGPMLGGLTNPLLAATRSLICIHEQVRPRGGPWLIDRPERRRSLRIQIDDSRSLVICDRAETEGKVIRRWRSGLSRSERDQLLAAVAQPRHDNSGRLAFVFPGSGNEYSGMGRALAAAFPAVIQQQSRENLRLRSQYAVDVFWDQLRDVRSRDLLMGHVSFTTLVADIFAAFGVRPNVVIGSSLGVSASFFASRAWTDRDEMLRRLEASPLFATELAGPCHAVRVALGLSDNESAEWHCGIVPVAAQKVRETLAQFPHCYVLAVNTPDECVVGGPMRRLEQFAAESGLPFIPLTGVTAAHCKVVQLVEQAYRELHSLPTTHPADIVYYHPVTLRPIDLTRESAADAVVQQALHPIDLPGLVEAAYRDGVRSFVEIGPGGSCTRMIGRILAGRPHHAIAATAHPRGELAALIQCLTQLAEFGYAIDVSSLVDVQEAPELRRTFSVPIWRAPFEPRTSEPTFVDSSSAFTTIARANLAVAAAHGAYLAFARGIDHHVTNWLKVQHDNLRQIADAPTITPQPFLDRASCSAFATGKIGPVLGPAFAEIDSFPTRVRLPDEPLMLVDRIVSVEGQPLSLTQGRVVTEHDVTADRWYLDQGRMPTCVAVEAGQADLFLAGYLGIDLHTRGLAVYRLLDAIVTFHRDLPKPGEVIRYDIHIDRFFRQGETHLFRFRFEGTINGEPLLTMINGCAGFFTSAELAAGQGVVQTALDRRPDPRALPADWIELAPAGNIEQYDDDQINALRNCDLALCFGPAFSRLRLSRPTRLPTNHLRLIHRVPHLDPRGGRFGLGLVRAEADVHPDDWYLTCHFVDDMVMPGTLMYECCLHTLRVFLMRLGWVGEEDRVAWQPIPGVASKLKCRGQVITSTRKVTYEVAVKELGYRPEPYAIADVLMYADGKPIVEITNMSVRLTGTSRDELAQLWKDSPTSSPSPPTGEGRVSGISRPALYDTDRILAFAIGKPSEAFGEPYRIFDDQRVIARLPGPPYQFLDRIVAVDAPPWKVQPGGVVEAEYDVPVNAWYFDAYRRPLMPFAVLLEVALQPCGWLAAYMGSALTSDTDMSFRNLGGKATQHIAVTPRSGTLTTRVEVTQTSSSGGMLIQHYAFSVRDERGQLVYDGTTYFGFFSKAALSQQIGVRDFTPYRESGAGQNCSFPATPPFPDAKWRMVDEIMNFVPDGGPGGLGFVAGRKRVDPAEWFFAAHFHQDPVMPGSLGLEAFLQLLDVVADRRWGPNSQRQFMALGRPHEWLYRGQVIPSNREVTIQAEVTKIENSSRSLTANGCLAVDGRVIYRMTDFAMQG